MSDSTQSQFDQLVGNYYQAWFRFHPEAAVDAGVPGYGHLLRPYDDDDVGALIVLNEKLLAGLEEIDPRFLDADRALDYRVLRGAALIEHHELLERDWRRRDPVAFLPVNALYQLTVRPVADLATVLRARLEKVPAHLRGARAQLKTLPELVPVPWLNSAVAEARAGADFVLRLDSHPQIVGSGVRSQLQMLQEQASQALTDYARFLESEIAPSAAGDFAVGEVHFERLLRERHFVDMEASELQRFGERMVKEVGAQLRAVTRELRGDDDVVSLTRQITADHPPARELLDVYRREMRAAHQFLLTHDIVSLPARERLNVVETPGFLRHQIPFAAYLDPAPNDPEQRGHYYVTPASDDETLREHNRLGIQHTCVHEAWPGHHLQFVTANRNPAARSLPRLLNPSATLYEGWALYCEQLMLEQGFLAQPEQRFLLLRDRLWRALRVVIDVEIQVRGTTLEQAADRMVELLGFPRSQAMADLAWYSRAPAVPMGYALGWSMINALRGYVQTADEGFDLRAFHDRLLGAGSIALPLVICRQFGERDWEHVRGAMRDQNSA